MSARERRRHRARRSPFFVLAPSGKVVDVREHARTAGRENLPATTATTPNEIESAAILQYENDHLEAMRECREELGRLEAEFATQKDSLAHARDLRGVVERAKNKVDEILADDEPLAGLYRRMRDAHLVYRRTKGSSGREPRYPASRPLHLGILAVLLVVESVLNGSFFAAVSPGGWFGGISIAVAVALANVGSGFAVGAFILPYCGHPGRSLSSLARASVGAYAVGLLVLNSVLASWRAAAVETMGAGLGVSPVETFALFAFGVLASVIALIDGWKWDDPRPGVGPAHRAWMAAQRAYEAAKAERLAKFQAAINAIPESLRTYVQRTKTALGEMIRLRPSAVAEFEGYDEDRAVLHSTQVHVLQVYRGDNFDVRSTPTPAYFRTFPDAFPNLLANRSCLDAYALAIEDASQLLEQLRDLAFAIEAELRDLMAESTERFHTQVARLEREIEEAQQAGGTLELVRPSDRGDRS